MPCITGSKTLSRASTYGSCQESLLSEQVGLSPRTGHARTDSRGLYGLIVTKTYLQVADVYDEGALSDPEKPRLYDLPYRFTVSKDSLISADNHLLIIDSASGLGGTWNYDRLYPNLHSQNSYGMYEYSDFPMTSVVDRDAGNQNGQFIAEWKINQYLYAWSKMGLGCKVGSHPSKHREHAVGCSRP